MLQKNKFSGMLFILGATLFVILVIFIKVNKAEGLNLNFLQNDYQIKFERVELVSYNETMVKYVSVKTFKFNRTAAVVNATMITKIDMGHEIEAYKFMSNEYRYCPVRFAANVCLGAAANMAGIKTGALKCGNVKECKLLKNKEYHVYYWQPDPSKLPPYIPDGQYMIQVQYLRYSSEMMVMKAYATVFRPMV